MNATRRNRRQDVPAAQDAQVQEPGPDAQEPQEPATVQEPAQEPVQEPDGTQVPQETPVQEPVQEPQVQEPQASAQPDEPVPPAPDAPADEPGAGTEGEPEPERQRELSASELLAIAVSTEANVAQETRNRAFAAAAVLMLRGLLAKITALPEDQPVTADHVKLHISGANGRGVAGAKAALQVIVALFGYGYYEGSTHDSVKGVAERNMLVTAFVPDLFKADFLQLMSVLNRAGLAADPGHGVISHAEMAKRKAQSDHKKLHGLPAGVTDYAWMNKTSRNVMVSLGGEIAAAIAAQFPADDPQVAQIRQVITACQMAYVPGSKNAVLFPATNKYAVAPEPAQVLAGAQA